MNLGYQFFRKMLALFTVTICFTIPFFIQPTTCEAYTILSQRGAWRIINDMPFNFKKHGLEKIEPLVAGGESYEQYISFDNTTGAALVFICTAEGYVFFIKAFVPKNDVYPFTVPFYALWHAIGYASSDLNEAAQKINAAMMYQTRTSCYFTDLGQTFYFDGSSDGNYYILTISANKVNLNQRGWIEAY